MSATAKMNSTEQSPKFQCGTIAIIGRPNAGKSTLLNALLGTNVSATSNRPQTTRQNIKGIIQLYGTKKRAKDWTGQLVVVDTPGLSFKKGLLERSMFMAVQESLVDVDLIVWVADARTWARDLKDLERKLPGSDRVAEWLQQQVSNPRKSRWILCLSKVDLVAKGDLLPLMAKSLELLPQFEEIVPIASQLGMKHKNSNLEALTEVLKKYMPEHPALFNEDTWTDLSEQSLVANLIRESIFRQGKEEVPYESDCTIELFQTPESENKRPMVHATLWVSKDSLKPILVGKAGNRVRDLGIAVRERYKEVTGDDIIVKLFVKVREKWNKDASMLRQMGYAND